MFSSCSINYIACLFFRIQHCLFYERISFSAGLFGFMSVLGIDSFCIIRDGCCEVFSFSYFLVKHLQAFQKRGGRFFF